jgi:hypothetical protein
VLSAQFEQSYAARQGQRQLRLAAAAVGGIWHAHVVVIIELRAGLWMLKEEAEGVGVIRGYIAAVEAPDGIRYVARLQHLNPTQGPKLGEFWEWEKAVEAILAEQPRPIFVDPYRDLKYSDRSQRAERLEQIRRRRRFAGRLSD